MPLVSLADLAHAGRNAYDRFQLDDDVDTLTQAIGCLRIVNDHAQLPYVLADLGVYLHDRYGLTGNPSDLDEAIIFESECLTKIDPDHSSRPRILNNLGQFYNSRFESTLAPSDLREAIAQTHLAVMEAVKHDDESAPRFLDFLLELVATQTSYYAIEDDSAEAFDKIEEFLNVGRTITKARHYDQIANLYYNKSEITSQLPELLKAISHAESALHATVDDTTYRAIRLTNLANYQLTLYENTSQGDILRDAIQNTREAVKLASDGTNNALVENMALASALHHNYHWSGQVDDLHEAIEIGFQVVTATAPQDTDWLNGMQNLSLFVRTGFKADGAIEDLIVVIDLLQQAMNNESLPHEAQGRSAAMALDLLEVKYEATRSDQDFALAMNAYSTAIHHQSEEHGIPDAIWKRQSRATATMSTLFRRRFERSKDPQDIDTSVVLARRIPSVENSLNVSDCTSALALALWTDFRVRGGMEKLDEAVDLAKSIVQRQPPRGADYLGSLNNLSGICQTRYDATGNEADLRTCIDSALEGLSQGWQKN